MSTKGPLKIRSLEIPPEEQTPLVLALVEIIRSQDEEIKALRDEIDRLKGTTRRPKIKPSRLPDPDKGKQKKGKGKRPGANKRVKTRELPIHPDVPLTIEGLPEGSTVDG